MDAMLQFMAEDIAKEIDKEVLGGYKGEKANTLPPASTYSVAMDKSKPQKSENEWAAILKEIPITEHPYLQDMMMLQPPPEVITPKPLSYPVGKFDPDTYFTPPPVDTFHWTIDKHWTPDERQLVREAHKRLHKLLVENMYKLASPCQQVTLNLTLKLFS